MKLTLHADREMDVILAALYGGPVKGGETLRLFDKVLSALEHVAHIEYDENGNVRFFKNAGNDMERLTYLKHKPATIELQEGWCSFLRSRIEAIEWTGQAVRDVLRVLAALSQGENQVEQ